MTSQPDIFFIKTLADEYLQRTLESFEATLGSAWSSIPHKIVKELSSREETLNKILSLRDPQRDLFIIADDIIFKAGWYDHLQRNINRGEIFGFTMVNPATGLLQNFGFDFVRIDGSLSYRGFQRDMKPDDMGSEDYRECDAVTGCAMYIKRVVLHKISSFPDEGANRWGELIFAYLAKQKGYTTIVLSAKLEHLAISTKQKKTAIKSSLSWLIERELWEVVVSKYFVKLGSIQDITQNMGPRLDAVIRSDSKLLIYGCGTNSDLILSKIEAHNYTICAGLEEEIGVEFHGSIVQDVRKLDLSDYDHIIITPIGYLEKILPLFESADSSIISTLIENREEGSLFYELVPQDTIAAINQDVG
jgi:hypothetical protein